MVQCSATDCWWVHLPAAPRLIRGAAEPAITDILNEVKTIDVLVATLRKHPDGDE